MRTVKPMSARRSTRERKSCGVERPGRQEVVHRDFHEDDHVLALHQRLLHELRGRAVEHVHVHVGHRPEAAALDQDRLLVEHLGGLEDLALRAEHDRVGQAELHEVSDISRLSTCSKPGREKCSMSISIRSVPRLSRRDSISFPGRRGNRARRR